ncbi:hypothetical protein [Streptomyces sp. NPDC016845]|uniref:hypothetical protein n=1 Tax=Streptomyces sp. NPDC016845 TaxID=3364972 RepID=UPI003794C1DA
MSVNAVLLAVLASTVGLAAPASAAGYHCRTSSHSLDTPQYSGPWADNWDVHMTLCAKRRHGWVYAYARVRWDGPNGQLGGGFINDAYVRVQVRHKAHNFHGITDRWDSSNHNGDYNGSYTTGVVKWKGRSKSVAAGSLNIDWKNHGDGRTGYAKTRFRSSPRV